MPSLLNYAMDPNSSPDPLPDLADRRHKIDRDGFTTYYAWPLPKLPYAALAADLADNGHTYSRHTGHMKDGDRLTVDELAKDAAALLRHAADYLALNANECMIDDRATVRQQADALRLTAADVMAAPGRRRNVASLLALELPAPVSEATDRAAALRWLAALDHLAEIRRPELARRYAEAGAPGHLPASDLRALAAERWGRPVKSSGNWTYRPARRPGNLPKADVPPFAREEIHADPQAAAQAVASSSDPYAATMVLLAALGV